MANPKLVNKQFNTPIGLYSEQNIKEVLEREQQILANGAVGINFHNSAAGKPANLQNSAVLRMLEEEEQRQRGGRAGNDYIPRPLQENVAWPPPEHDQKMRQRSSFKDVVIPGVKRVAWPPPQEGGAPDSPYVEQTAASAQGGPQYPSQSPGLQQNNYSHPAPHQRPVATPQPAYRPLKPLDVNSVASGSPQASPIVNQSPAGFRPATPSKGWAPVHSPVTTPGAYQHQNVPQQWAPSQQYQSPQYQPQPQYQPVSQQYQAPSQQYQPPHQPSQTPQQYQAQPQQYQAPSQQYQASSQQYQAPGQQYQAVGQQYQTQNQYQAVSQQQYQTSTQTQQYQSSVQQPNQPSQPVAAQAQAAPRVQSSRTVEPPPSTITLRPQAPVSQAPPPVFSSQPATATLRGGKHLRGDLKWPPENVKIQMAEEEKQLIELSKGPACRPRKIEKDYSPFFAQHALNSTYPGYKIPPGTQFFRPV